MPYLIQERQDLEKVRFIKNFSKLVYDALSKRMDSSIKRVMEITNKYPDDVPKDIHTAFMNELFQKYFNSSNRKDPFSIPVDIKGRTINVIFRNRNSYDIKLPLGLCS